MHHLLTPQLTKIGDVALFYLPLCLRINLVAMKQFLLLVLFAVHAAANMAQSPIAYYPLDVNANDVVGSANGTNAGAIQAPERRSNGNNLYAYSFNGSSAHISLGSGNTIRPTSALTVSAWFQLENTAGAVSGRAIVSCMEASGYNLLYDKASDNLLFQVYRNGGNGTAATPAASYVNAGWHHIAGTYDGRYTRLYIDGELKATNDAGAVHAIQYTYPFGGVNTYIGAEASAGFNPDPNYYWQGRIDEVKIYSTALTIQEIRAEAGLLAGSGKALDFTGTSYLYHYCVSGMDDFAQNQDFTVEFWFKAPVNQTFASTTVNSLISNIDGNHYNYDIYIYNPPHAKAGKLETQRWDGTNNPYTTSLITVNDNKWHHCALVRSGGASGNIALYIDGIFQSSVPDNTTNTTTGYLLKAGGVGCCGYGNFSGNIDELRIWNTGLTPTQLRQRMCRKITIEDVLWNNLTLYYRMDEADLLGTGNGNATFINDSKYDNGNASFQGVAPHITSGASIGNISATDYSAAPAVTLAHPQGESLQATVTTGSPSGIHVYCVNDKPNTASGATNVGDNDRYFGVFVAGGTSPQYDAVYHYNGNPNVNGGNENSLVLYKRDNNADASWEDGGAVLNTTNKTLTATGQNTEYLLGGAFNTLPITLLRFEAMKQTNVAQLKWTTTYEQNNRGFEVLHSTDGTHFSPLGFVAGVGNSSSKHDYSFTHLQPAKGKNYYRLKQIDIDNRGTWSKILVLDFSDATQISFYPNPVSDALVIQAPDNVTQLTLLDATGKKLWQQSNVSGRSFTVDVHTLGKGIMLMQTTNKDGSRVSYKLMKQ